MTSPGFVGFEANQVNQSIYIGNNMAERNSIASTKDACASNLVHINDENVTTDKENSISDNIEISNNDKVLNSTEETQRLARINTLQKLRYNANDQGPYRIVLEIVEKGKYINKLSIGRLLKTHRLSDNLLDIKKTSKTKLTIYLQTMEAANRLLDLTTPFAPKYVLYLPAYFVTVKGVISGIPDDMTIEELKSEIDTEYDILDAYRMNRFSNGMKQPSDRVCIAFRSTMLPKYIKICYIRSKVDPFIPKVVHCAKCLKFNHDKKGCKGKSKCNNCSNQNCPSLEKNEQCIKEPYCMYCKKNHRIFDKPLCTELGKQKQIKKIMASHSLSYIEVLDEFDFLSRNKFETIDPDNEPIKMFEKYRFNKMNHPKKHRTITKIDKQTQCENIEKENKINSRKRNRDENEEYEKNQRVGVELENPHRTSELERLISQLQQKLVENNDNFKRILFNIYEKITKNEDLEQLALELEKNLEYIPPKKNHI